jgi:hypothetical protein
MLDWDQYVTNLSFSLKSGITRRKQVNLIYIIFDSEEKKNIVHFARLEAFRALKFSRLDSFRALKASGVFLEP